MKISAIYSIINLLDGKIYIGSSRDARKRLYVHRWKLDRGDHDNVMLQRAWIRDGEAAFAFDIVEECQVERLLEREQAWIDSAGSSSRQRGYNFCQVAGTRAGTVQPESVRASSRAAHLGKPKTSEHRARIGDGNRGKKKSDAHKQKLREAAQRQYVDPQARARAAEFARGQSSPFKGKRHSEQSIANMRAAAEKRWAGVPRKPRIARAYVPVPSDQRRKSGPVAGTPRPDRRAFSNGQVREIRQAKSNGASFSQLAKRFETNVASLHAMVHRKTYADVD